LHIYLDILCGRKIISQKIDFFCAMCKKDKFWCSKNLFWDISFIFFIENTNNIGLPRNLPENVRTEFLSNIFNTVFFQRHDVCILDQKWILGRFYGSAWYISNVSLIFDAPCLFLHHLLSVLLHFVAFLCIFRN
jgi:hypothetical protein